MQNTLKQFIATRVENANISCKTLIVTVFGDIVSQHNEWIWLGSLIESLSPLGYSERLVRTSVFRLVEDDWLQTKKVGRKSYYSLSHSAKQHNEKAARRIYSASSFAESDDWLIVLPSFVAEDKLQQLRKQLKWLGFSSISSSVYAHPSCERASLEDTINEMGLLDSILVFSGRTIDDASNAVLKKLVFEKWHLNELQKRYDQFIADYSFILSSDDISKINSSQSFLLRILLIHEFRRILLKDHELSEEMLPIGWCGEMARKMVIDIYHTLEEKSVKYIKQNIENFDGFLLEPSEEFYLRFRKSI